LQVWRLLKNKYDNMPAAGNSKTKRSSIIDENAPEPIEKPLLFLARWLELGFYRDFLSSKYLYAELKEFIGSLGTSEIANRFKLLILKNAWENAPKKTKSPFRKSSNDSTVPNSPGRSTIANRPSPSSVDLRAAAEKKVKSLEPGKFDLQDLDPLVLAQQLTLIEAELFYKIVDAEFFHMAWRKENDERTKVAPNVVKLVDRFNKVSYWVATEIVMSTNIKDRVNLMKKFIAMAEHLRDMGNFNGVMEVVAGLNLWSITRLKETWEQLPTNVSNSAKEMNALMENKQNYRLYRQALKTTKLPILPYLGIYLRDLTFIEEGNSDWVGPKEDGLVNMDKLNLIAQIILEVKRFQTVPFAIDKDPVLAGYLSKLLTLPEEMLYKHSLLCETMTANQ